MKTLSQINRQLGPEVKLNLLSAEGWEDIMGGKKLSVREAYQKQAWFQRAVRLRGSALASVPYTLEGMGVEWHSASGEPLPSAADFFQDGKRCLTLVEMSLCTEGAAYLFKLYDNTVQPTALQYWIPTNVEPIVNVNGLQGFRRIVGTLTELHLRENVVFFSDLSPYVEAGVGDAEGAAGRVSADVLRSMDTFLDGYLDSGLIAATVVATKRKIGDKEKDSFLAGWRERFRKKSNQDPLILNANDAEIHQIGGSLQDLANTDVTEDQRKSIAAAFGIPHSLLFSDAANYATKERDQLEFMRWTVQPRAELIADTLNEQLFEPAGMNFAFDFASLEVYQAEELKKAQGAAAYATALIGLVEVGILELSEAQHIARSVLSIEGETKAFAGDGYQDLFGEPMLKRSSAW